MSAGIVPVLFFCLATGAAMGCLLLVFQAVRLLLGDGRLLTAILDVVFCCLCAFVVFACALAVDRGRLRLIQVAAQLLGGWAAVEVFAAPVKAVAGWLNKIICKISGVFNKCGSFLTAGFRRKKSKSAKKRKKRKEKPKKAQKKT